MILGLDGRSIEKIEKTSTGLINDVYKITYTDNSTFTYSLDKGVRPQITATPTDEGYTLTISVVKDNVGNKDEVYFDVVNGKSAYEIAKAHGFSGTETEWLLYLQGNDGVATTYENILDKPKINNIEISGNKSASDYGLAAANHSHSGYAAGYNGVATSAAAFAGTAGSAVNPVFINQSGKPEKTTYTLNKSVPANAVFTDTVSGSPATNVSAWRNIYAGTEDLEAGVSNLATGTIYIVYEE